MKLTSRPHFWYYVSLSAILLLGFTLIVFTNNVPQMQMVAIVMTTFFYVFWGIAHHMIHHDTTAKVVVEYVLIGAIAIALMLLLVR